MKKAGFSKIIPLATILIFASSGYTQNSTIDSLQNLLLTQKEDTSKVNTLNALCVEFRTLYKPDLKKASQYANLGLRLAERIQYKTGIADAYLRIGDVYTVRIKYDDALKNYFKASKIYDDLQNKKGSASIYGKIATVYLEQGKFGEAKSYYLSQLRIWEELGDGKNIAATYLSIGDLLGAQENYAEALPYVYKSLKIYEEIKDSRGIANADYAIGWIEYKQGNYAEARKKYAAALKTYQALDDKANAAVMYRNLGEMFFLQGNYEAALKHNQVALKSFEETQQKLLMGWAYTGIGSVYEQQGFIAMEGDNNSLSKIKFAGALEYYIKALEIWKEANYKANTSESYINISNVYQYLKNVPEAKKNLRFSFPLALGVNSKEVLRKYYKSLSHLDSIEGNYKQAYEHYKKYINYRDSVVNDETTKRLSQTTMQYEFEKKEALAKAEQTKKDLMSTRVRNMQYSAIGVVILIALFLFWNNTEQKKSKTKIEKAYADLKATQQQLIQSEKMASLGELTAGIAHEIQNPLNFVNNFSEVNKELTDELLQEAEKGNLAEVKAIAKDLKENEQKINHHGKRADAIVKSMLQHSRSSSGQKELTDINALADEYLKLAYHGVRAKDGSFNATIKTDYDQKIGTINIIPQDMGRVILNLITNAFYAVTEKKKEGINGYDPTVTVSTKRHAGGVEIKVADNGNGIPERYLDKIFQPFFTTKPTGEGTGLGLSLSYDIVKAHGGDLIVETEEKQGSQFIISLLGKQNES